MGAEIKSKFLRMLHVTLYYIVLVSHPEYMKVDEFEMMLPICGYIAAKRTSRELLGKDLANGRISRGQRSLAGFGAGQNI